jgi:G:T-mismatch repair DNA endonuclease (very short patch repair protein)
MRMPKIYRRNCDYCGKYYEGVGSKFCSRECAYKGRKVGPGLWWYEGKPNPTIGRKHTEEERKKESEIVRRLFAEGKRVPAWRGKKGWKNPKLSETKKRLYAEGKLAPWNKGKKAPQITLGLKRALKEGWNPRANKHFRPNNPEKKVCAIIKEHSFPLKYVGNGKFILEGFNPDFVSVEHRKIVEVFGDYWHNLPKIVKRDKERIRTYSKYGFKTLILWEGELRSLPENIIAQKIEAFINE